MDAPASAHPPADTVAAYGRGKLAGRAAEAVAAHVAACPDCRRLADLAAAGRPRDTLSTASGTTSPTAASPKATPMPLLQHPDYEVVRELGRGGMGVVYLARHRLMNRPEVLKVVNRALLDKPGVEERFLREIQSAAQLHHPNIVSAFSVARAGDLLMLAMEYVEGEDLAEQVRSRGPLPVQQACYCAHQAALGLQHAFEKGMVHRDIKPSNLIVARDGRKLAVKILDFGLAKATSERGADRELTGAGKMLGTPDYVAPEQTLDAAKADTRADIYSLGCTLYYLLTGGPPFKANSLYELLHAHQAAEATPLNEVRPEVPAALAAVVARMMAKRPEDRFQTPAEVAKALAPFVKSSTKGTPPVAAPAVPTAVAPRTPTPPARTEPEVIDLTPYLRPVEVGPARRRSAGSAEFEALSDGPSLAAQAPKSRAGWYWAISAIVATVVLVVVLILLLTGVVRATTENGTKAGNEQIAATGDPKAAPAPGEAPSPPAPAAPETESNPQPTPAPPANPPAAPPAPAPEALTLQATERFTFQADGSSQMLCTALHPDGRHLAAGSGNGQVRLWDLNTGREVLPPRHTTPPPGRLAFSPDGHALAVLSMTPQDGTRSSCTVFTGLKFERGTNFTGEFTGRPAFALAFRPGGRTLAALTEDGQLYFKDLTEPRRSPAQPVVKLPGRTIALAFSPDARRLALAGDDGQVRLLDVASQSLAPGGLPVSAWGLAFRPTAPAVLAVCDRDGRLRLWDCDTGRERLSFRLSARQLGRPVFHPNGRFVATGHADGQVCVWDVATGRQVLALAGPPALARDLDISPDGRWLAVASVAGTVKVWELTVGGGK